MDPSCIMDRGVVPRVRYPRGYSIVLSRRSKVRTSLNLFGSTLTRHLTKTKFSVVLHAYEHHQSAMNFGGGPPFGSGPPFTNVPPYGFPPQFPGMVPPMTAMSGMPLGQPLPTIYPPGQGPLAGRAVQRGANGLFEAPEPEGPEVHGTSSDRELLVTKSGYTTDEEERSSAKNGLLTACDWYCVVCLSFASRCETVHEAQPR